MSEPDTRENPLTISLWNLLLRVLLQEPIQTGGLALFIHGSGHKMLACQACTRIVCAPVQHKCVATARLLCRNDASWAALRCVVLCFRIESTSGGAFAQIYGTKWETWPHVHIVQISESKHLHCVIVRMIVL
jgi:hypothetical protein